MAIILSVAIAPDTRNWHLCNGSAIKSSSKAYKLGLRNTPNLINRYMMGSNTYGAVINQTIQSHKHTTQPHNHLFGVDISDYDNGNNTQPWGGPGNRNATTSTTVIVNSSGSTYTRPNSIAVLFYMRIN